MELLITPAQVAQTAFRAPDLIDPEAIPESTILAAQQKFIRPVFGGLYTAMCAGRYAAFAEEYILPALALYVKMLMLPSLAVQAGRAGLVELDTQNLARAGEAKIRQAVRRLRSDASALIGRAVEQVENNPAQFPEYDPRDNIRRRCSTAGQVVL